MPNADLYYNFIKTCQNCDIRTLFHSFASSFSFCFVLISEVFLGIDIYLSSNNVGIAVEINFLFINLSV